jgi:hypothetical protein
MISEALLKLGYDEFVVRGDTFEGIEWIVEPATFPTKEEVLDMVSQLEVLKQQEVIAKAAAKESALTKLQALGLSEAEAKQIVGI